METSVLGLLSYVRAYCPGDSPDLSGATVTEEGPGMFGTFGAGPL